MSSAHSQVDAGQESDLESDIGAQTIISYVQNMVEEMALNPETLTPSPADTANIVLTDVPSQEQVVLRRGHHGRQSGDFFKRSRPEGVHSDTRSVRNGPGSLRVLTQPTPQRPTPLSILDKHYSSYKRPEVHDDQCDWIRRISEALNIIPS